MYNADNIYDERYLAKKDWITGKWLDLEKDYNSPLIIAVMFLFAGIQEQLDDVFDIGIGIWFDTCGIL